MIKTAAAAQGVKEKLQPQGLPSMPSDFKIWEVRTATRSYQHNMKQNYLSANTVRSWVGRVQEDAVHANIISCHEYPAIGFRAFLLAFLLDLHMAQENLL